DVPSFRRAPRLAALGDGNAVLHATGVYESGRLDAALEAIVRSIRARGVGIGFARIAAKVSGPPAALWIETVGEGTSLRISRLPFSDLALRASGPLDRPRVLITVTGHGARIAAQATAIPRELGARDIAVEVQRGSQRVHIGLATLRARRGIELGGLR